MRIYLDQPVDSRTVAQYLRRFDLGDPIDRRIWIGTPSLGESREGVNDVADGSELNEKDAHLMTMLPKMISMFEPIFCGVPEQI